MEEDGKLHILVLPWLAFGHMIPYLELSKYLAQLGHTVSFLSTPRNIDRLPILPPDLRSKINLVKLTPPPIEGLSEDAQSTADVSHEQCHLLQKLLDGLEEPLCAFMEADHNRSPDWILYDLFVYWVPRIADKYGINSAFFGPVSAMAFTIIGPPSVLLDSGKEWRRTPEKLTVPPPWIPFSTNVAFRYHEASTMVKIASLSDGSGVPQRYRFGMTFQGCHVAAVRSCLKLEPEWIPLLSQLLQKPVFPVGLLSPLLTGNDSKGDAEELWVGQEEWLNVQKHGSVVYVAFGSELRLSREHVHELAFGLELSELPFFWAYRGEPGLLPDGFEERTKVRGIVCMGWAPQARLLAHPSVGCFLTHCGWASSVEGLAHANPLIMLPFIACQGLSARVMEEKKVGVEVPRNEQDGSFTREAVAKSLKLVMVEDEGATIRSNARQMMEIYRDKEQQVRYIEDFANYLVQHRRGQHSTTVATHLT